MSGGKVSQPMTTVKGLLVTVLPEASVTLNLSIMDRCCTSRFYRSKGKKERLDQVFALKRLGCQLGMNPRQQIDTDYRDYRGYEPTKNSE